MRLIDADALMNAVMAQGVVDKSMAKRLIIQVPTVCCEACKHGIKGERVGDYEYVYCTKPYAEICNSHTKDWFCGDWRDKDAVD